MQYTMLPVLDQNTADANPGFEAVYNDLCKNKLEVDATSVLDPESSREKSVFDGVGTIN